MKLADLILRFEELWPSQQSEEWDVVGLVSGNLDQEIQKILLTVDVTQAVVDEAIDLKVDLILAHHPFLLKGVTSVQEQSSKGSVVSKLIKHDIALFSAHTNADIQANGTSVQLAKKLGLKNQRPLIPTPAGFGIGVVGETDLTMLEVAAALDVAIPQTVTGIRGTGDFSTPVKKIAICAGAGDSYLQDALDSGADLYITSDLRHHPALEIREQAKARGIEFHLMDIPHWAAEFVWLEQARRDLESTGLVIDICDIRTDVFDYLVNLPPQDDLLEEDEDELG